MNYIGLSSPVKGMEIDNVAVPLITNENSDVVYTLDRELQTDIHTLSADEPIDWNKILGRTTLRREQRLQRRR